MSINTLVRSNIDALSDAADLLQSLPQPEYSGVVSPLSRSSLGQHMRHVLEHYDCLLQGLCAGLVNYDQRPRRQSLEQDPQAAIQRIEELSDELKALPPEDQSLAVLSKSTLLHDEPPVPSSLARELLFLHAHSTHHFAQMALHMRSIGANVGHEFGIAPSTLAYEHSVGTP